VRVLFDQGTPVTLRTHLAGHDVATAFEAGWGGVVWKTLGEDPHIVNVSSRYGAVQLNGQRVAGMNNIELITDRPLQVNLDEIRQVKRDWPDRAMVVSLMVPCDEASWKRILPLVEDSADPLGVLEESLLFGGKEPD